MDPYRISEAPQASPPAADASAQGGIVRPVLWLVLVVSTAANAVASTTGINMFVGIGSGLVALASAIALSVHHYQHRRR
ncbi:hypothetical protein ACRYCC_38455 [Actinomadura scrupuli]|uniref:hypothetical protein n=1 Tax=Actinomadura scrupuli TaxID=559629 RepID=UPI003D9733D6